MKILLNHDDILQQKLRQFFIIIIDIIGFLIMNKMYQQLPQVIPKGMPFDINRVQNQLALRWYINLHSNADNDQK